MRRFLALLLRHPLSLFGVGLTTVSALLFLALSLLDALGYLTNPYLGLVVFVTLPILFIVGLVLIPVGDMLRRRKPTAEGAEARWPRLDLNDPTQRRIAGVLLVATLGNAVILSMGTVGGIHYMESPQFCGQVCHEVMEPQFASHQGSPHARVTCAACHVGSGAAPFIETKLRGTRQLYGVVTNRFPRPIRAPAAERRPARDTCENCHWPEKFHGDKLLEAREYAEDETNTETVTLVRLHVGGGSERLGVATGIHWHMNLHNAIEYLPADGEQGTIPYVKLTDRDGNVNEYFAEGVARDSGTGRDLRRMDCMDCHNRAAHAFAATPEQAVNHAMALGRISKDLPFIRREAAAALKEAYTSRDEAASEIAARLTGFYHRSDPDLAASDAVARAIRVTQDLWAANIFPRMNVNWGTYGSQIGHTDAAGCFRCHDDSHKTDDGAVIRQDCETCHAFE